MKETTKQKILLVLLTGVGLGLSHSPRTQRTLLKNLPKEFREIDSRYLHTVIRRMQNARLISVVHSNHDTFNIILTPEGKRAAGIVKLKQLQVLRGKHWDHKWRLIVYDIPEEFRRGRNALRNQLKTLGAVELQKSVWVFPFPCKDIIDELSEFYGLYQYVRYIDNAEIDKDKFLRKQFQL